MPVIDIRERDNTSAGFTTEQDYVVFVPGGSRLGSNLDKFILLNDADELVEKFGECPVYSGDVAPYSSSGLIRDPGYLTTKFLLNSGFKVLYKSPSKAQSTPYDTFEGLVAALSQESFYDDLDDKGLYDIRFLTLGGYVTTPNPNYTNIKTFTNTTGSPAGYTEDLSHAFECYYIFANVDVLSYQPSKYYYYDTTLTLPTWVLDNGEFNADREYYVKVEYEAGTFFYQNASGQYVLDDSQTSTPGRVYYIAGGAISAAISKLQTIASERGDCLLLLDHPYNLTDVGSILASAQLVTSKYAAMFSPWCKYPISGSNITLPASVAYLDAFINAVNDNPTWYATAGRLRGTIKGTPIYNYGEKKANLLTPDTGVAVNPITTVNPYGILIWGNRTLWDNALSQGLIASSFLNIRQLVIDLKKQLYRSSKAYMFEQNSDRLWFNFKSQIQQLLDIMKTNQGIKDYKMVKVDTTVKATLAAIISIIPIEGVEKFNLLVELVDSFNVTEA